MAGASFSAALPKAEAAGSKRETFDLYDSLLFIGKPDLSRYGLRRARTVYEHELGLPKLTPDEAAVRSKARAVLAEGVTAAVPVILDVEEYSVDVRSDISDINPDTSTVDTNILKLEQIIGWFKNEAPTLQVGFFDVAAPLVGLPVTGQQPANDAELAIWKRANSYLIPFATHVDTLYPSLYTVDTDPAKWVASAQRCIAEAKRIGAGKPVRPFVWPQYHDVMRHPLAGTYIDYDYWMLQLTTIRNAGASGIIFWGGYQKQWDDTQNWWRATLDFVATM
ncbi:MAG: hypothetical protein WBE71_20240 [Xanthobacteraceae bacterium]